MAAKPLSEPEEKDVAALLDEALEDAGITQYELAKRLSEERGTHLGSQDQAIRRIRRYGQTPTDDVARDLARAFSPELDLADDHFISARPPTVAQVREAALQALAEVERLRARVSKLEKLVKQLSPAAEPPARPGGPRSRRAAG